MGLISNSTAAGLAGVFLISSAARADDGEVTPAVQELEAVTVSAVRAVEQVREEPQAISVISGDDLSREDATTLEAIARRLANVKWNYGNSQTSNYSIRGIGKIANNPAADPSVGINVDGIPYAYNPLGSFNFHDVETASVWRGPQGLRGGKNSTIGQVNIRNKRASFTPGSEISIGYSTFQDQDWGDSNGSLKAFAAATGPLLDDLLAYRIALNVDKGGGWLLNKYNKDNQYISSDRVAGRLQLYYTPTQNLDARLTVDVNPRMQENANIGSTNFFFSQTPGTYANGGANTALTTEQRLSRPWFTRNADYTVEGDYYSTDFVNSDSQQAVVTGRNTYTLELGLNLGTNSRLSSITGFADYYFNAFRDDEGTVFDVQTAAGNHIWYRQKTQEFRLDSQLGELADYQLGAFLIWSEYNSGSNSVYGSDAGAWFATGSPTATTATQYSRLDANSAGRQLLTDSLAELWRVSPQTNKARSPALYANADWHLVDKLTVNTGIRATRERRGLVASQIIKQQGFGVDLNPAAFGGFITDGTNLLTGANSAAQLAAANRVALRYFGAASYAALTAAQRTQIADARTIRNGRIGTLHGEFRAESYRGTEVNWSISPRYELSAAQTFYFLVGEGKKAGVPVVLTNSGVVRSQLAKPERNRAFELGSKSTLLDGDLTVDATVFVNDIRNYLQNVFFVDELQTQINNGITVYASGTGNVPRVRAKGLELDVVYSGLANFEFRFSGAYNDARYRSFPTAAYPAERANESTTANPFLDISGETLPGASKVAFDVGIQYHRDVLNEKELRATLNTAYTSKFKSDNALSEYSWIPGTWITDATLSLGGVMGNWTAGVYVKNLFNDDTPRNRTWNAWAPQIPRQYGVNLTGRFN
jgi:outer membrane receptor protein involved in Fe transport